jgi:hypothetical protein
MAEHPHQPPDDQPASEGPPSPGDDTPERVARSLGRFARRVARSARVAADAARPEAERLAQQTRHAAETAIEAARPEAARLARQARSAAQAARPHIEDAAQRAKHFIVEHDEELKRAGAVSARMVAGRAIPPVIRPFVDAVGAEFLRPRPPLADHQPPLDTTSQPPPVEGDAEDRP